MSEPLVSLCGVSRTFIADRRRIAAVQDVDLDIGVGDVVSVIGESGSGKTTVGRMVAGLLAPTAGEVLYRDRPLAGLDRATRKRFRLDVQLVHQDPYGSLNPAQTVGSILAAPIRRHRIARSRAAVREHVLGLLRTVDLAPAERIAAKYPHQLSGGQRQRVAIARALTVNPRLIVADEAVSMIDMSLRVSILETLDRLREERGLALLFITHDLAVARHIGASGRIAVMHTGRVVEVGPAARVIDDPQHPYTRTLIAAASHEPLDVDDDALAVPAPSLRESANP